MIPCKLSVDNTTVVVHSFAKPWYEQETRQSLPLQQISRFHIMTGTKSPATHALLQTKLPYACVARLDSAHTLPASGPTLSAISRVVFTRHLAVLAAHSPREEKGLASRTRPDWKCSNHKLCRVISATPVVWLASTWPIKQCLATSEKRNGVKGGGRRSGIAVCMAHSCS
jgi:hypothetical protein